MIAAKTNWNDFYN